MKEQKEGLSNIIQAELGAGSEGLGSIITTNSHIGRFTLIKITNEQEVLQGSRCLQGGSAVGLQTRWHAFTAVPNSTTSRLQRCFKEFGSTSNQPHRPRWTTPAQDLHIQRVHRQDCLRPAARTADETFGLHKQRISAQSVRNRLREAHLHARHPYRCHGGCRVGWVMMENGRRNPDAV